jgi:hypothetical protein
LGARLIARAVALALLTLSGSAAAAVELQGEAAAVDARALDELVSLELGEAREGARVVVRIEDRRALVEVLTEGERRSGTVALPDSEVERTIALFVGELARRPNSADPAEPAPPPDDPLPTPIPQARPDDQDDDVRVYVLGTMGVRWLTSGGHLVPTPRIEGGVLIGDALRLGAVARYAWADADDVLGSANVLAVTGGFAATWAVTDALGTGPRVELGAFSARGEGQNAGTASAVAISGAWELELRARLTRTLALLFAAEAGWYARGIELRADDRALLELSGGFLGVSIGAAALPQL